MMRYKPAGVFQLVRSLVTTFLGISTFLFILLDYATILFIIIICLILFLDIYIEQGR